VKTGQEKITELFEPEQNTVKVVSVDTRWYSSVERTKRIDLCIVVRLDGTTEYWTSDDEYDSVPKKILTVERLI